MKTPVLLARSCFTSLVLLASASAVLANNELWVGTNNVSADTNWSDNLNWTNTTGGGGPGPNGNSVYFGNGGAPNPVGVVDSVVDQNGLNPFSLTLTNSSAAGFSHTILIQPGVNVTNANGLIVGIQSLAANNFTITDSIVGPGTLVEIGTPLQVDNSSSTGSSGQLPILDLSGLSNFVYLDSAGAINVAGTSGSEARGSGQLILAVTNTITVGTISMATATGNGGLGATLYLGAGTNTINVGTMNLGAGKINTATMAFSAATTTGGVRIRGVTGADSDRNVNITLGNRGTSGTGTPTGTLGFTNGHPIDVKVNSLTMGRSSQNGSGVGNLLFDTGTFDATTITMGINSSNGATGTITMGGGTLIVSNMSLVNQTGPGTTTGNLIINAGTMICSNSIIKTTVAGTGNITMNGGSLIVRSNIGSAAMPIDNVSLNNATLQLNVVGGASTPVINGLNVTASGVNTLNLNVSNVNGSANIPLISYTGADPGTNTFVINVPTNFIATLDDNGSTLITLDLVPTGVTIYPLLWVGAVGSTVNGNWNYTTANWENLTNPAPLTYTNPDLVTFDDSASNSSVNLTANFTPGSLTFSNGITPNPLTGNPLAYTLTGAGSIGGTIALVDANSGSVTLQETGGDNFSGGVQVGSGGTVVLDNANSSISGGAVIAGGATLQIGNNDANGNLPTGPVLDNGTLIFKRTASSVVSTDITGGGNLIKAGSGTLTLTVSNEFTGTTTVTNGILILTNAGSLAANNTVDVDGNATLDVSGVTGVPTFQNLTLGNCTLTQALTNQQTIAVSGSLTLNGSSTITINVTSLPPIAAYPTILTNVLGSGLGNGGPTLHVGSLPPGYAGNLSISGNGIILTLTSGPIGVRPNVTWSGADLATSINWSDAQNWQLPGAPLATDNVIFNDTDAQGSSAYNSPGGGAANLNLANVNNNVNANFTVSTLNYTNLAAMYQNTYITDGMTLTVTGSMGVGSSSTDFGSSASEFVTFAGTNGTLTVDNTNSTFFVGLVFAGQGSEQATLDMSGLGTFNASVSNFGVGALSSTAFGTIGTAYLAETNNITAIGSAPNESGQNELLSFMVGETGKNGSGTCNLYLGQQNTIFANSVGVSLAKEVAQMSFNPTFVSPTATFFGADGVGTPVSVWAIGDGLAQTGGSTQPTGTVDFTGGTVNALVTTMYIGRSPNASGPHPSTGTLTFGAGTIDVGTMFIGFQAFSNTDNGIGTVNVNGTGILQVGTLNVAQTTGGSGAATTTGTLIINGGAVDAGTIVGNATGLGQSTITLQSGGTLAISNTAGTLAAPLTTLNLDGGTLQLTPINGGTNIVATTVSVSGTTTINIAFVANASGTMQIPLIYYGASADPFTSLTLGTTPVGFTSPSLVDDTANQTVDLMITAPPTLTWAGALSNGSLDGNWNTVDQNWLNGASFVSYAIPDGALFNDSASNSVVDLTTTLTPISLTVNNSASNYVFNGAGSIGGPTSLTKQGTATLTLDNSGTNAYSGGTVISGGTLQVGNNDGNGNLPGGNVADNASLVFDRTSSNNVTAVISGSGTVTQIGSGMNLFSGVNSYSGATLVSSGTLIVGNAGGPSGTNSSLGAIPGGAVTITNGGTMDLGGNSTANQLGFTNLAAATAKQFFVAGAGVGGNGAIVNNGTVSQIDALQYVTLTANATVGGPTRWDMRGAGPVFPVLNLTNNTLTKTGTNQISIVGATVTSGNIVVNQGILSFDTYVVFPTGSTGTITVNSAGSLGQFRGSLNSATNAGNAAGLTRPITLNGGAITNVSTSAPIGTNDAPITLTANSTLGGSTASNYPIVFDGAIGDGLGGFGITKAGFGPVVLTAINTYGGATLVNAGSLALAGNGSISSSSTITVALGATLDASGRTDQTLTLNNGQTLNGFGSVTGLVVAASGSTVAPGSSSSLGVLTVSSNSTVNGNTLMKLNTSTNDVLAAGGTVTYGGTLTLTNISVTPLAAGNSFKLFNAGVYSSAFASIVTQPPLGAGLSWSNSGSGVFTIVSTGGGPTTNASITHVSLSGTNLLVHGTNNNVPNTNFHYAVLTSTNLAIRLSNWTIVATNSFNPDGTFDYTNPIVPGTPRQFIDVKAVP